MGSWPVVTSISNPSYGFKEEQIRPIVRADFEGNYAQTRPRATRVTHRFTLPWDLMTEGMYQVLATHVKSYTGEMFGWTHPVTTTVYTCRIVNGTLESTITHPGFRRASVEIEEV